MISIIHPSMSRPEKSIKTIDTWMELAENRNQVALFVICNADDPELPKYKEFYNRYKYKYESSERDMRWASPVYTGHRDVVKSAVSAINYGAYLAFGDESNNILIVVSDDTECFQGWDAAILKEVEGKTDWILKTKDGIQDYIITNPIMDRAYYNRTGYIYHPDYAHLFCDTFLTCVADITGRKITSNLMFKHNHYSVNGTQPDELHKRNDATWKQGQETFIRLMNQFSLEERRRIKDQSMKNWLRNKGVQI